ncbi:MAG: hypothetical protein ACOCUY_02015, partial [Verrucomicrobiota bacterium]
YRRYKKLAALDDPFLNQAGVFGMEFSREHIKQERDQERYEEVYGLFGDESPKSWLRQHLGKGSDI